MNEESSPRRRELDYYESGTSMDILRRSAKQHGYNGTTRFVFSKMSDYLLHLVAYFSPLPGLRTICQRKRGVKIGRNVLIGLNVVLDLSFPEYIVIEDGVSLAGMNRVLAHSAPLKYHQDDFPSYVAPVIIRKNAWITIGATILPGVTIGAGAVVAPGSVVSRDVPPLTLVAGNPARVIRKLSGAEQE